jgi:hypothetical protein
VKTKTWIVCLALAVAAQLSCGKYESCDPGQVLQFNVCFPGVVDAGSPDLGSGGAGGSTGGSCRPSILPDAGDDICLDKSSGFGERCSADSQCRCGKNLCAIIPGETCGFCTVSNCMVNPSVCPAGWTCFDAAAFQPGYSLCVKM